MKKSDELFRLIRSLSKTEKRYFRMFASMQGGEKKYLLLFDAIDAQESYDEAAIRERFSSERFTRQFNVAKRYLYEQILKVLRLYHDDSSARARVRDMIASAEILFEKGLNDQAIRMIDRAVRHAAEHQIAASHVDALTWRRQLITGDHSTVEEFEQAFGEIDTAIDMLRNTVAYERLEWTFTASQGNTAPRTSRELEPLDEFAAHPLLRDEEQALTLRSRVLRRFILSHYHYVRRELAESLEHMMRAVELYESSPAYRLEYLDKYCCALHNAIFLSRKNLDSLTYRRACAKLRTVSDELLREPTLAGARVRSQIIFTTQITLTTEALMLGRFDEALASADGFDREFVRYAPYVSAGRRLFLYHNLSNLYFCAGNLERALDYNNRVLAEEPPPNGRLACYHARLINMIIHFEMGNIELLPYLVRSAYRYFRSRRIIYRFESVTLAFFRKLPDVRTPAELAAAFGGLYAELRDLTDDPHEMPMLEFFTYLQWLQSRAEQRDIGEILRANATFGLEVEAAV